MQKIKLASAWTVYGEEGLYDQHNTNNDICSVIYLDVEEEIAHTKWFFLLLFGRIKLFHQLWRRVNFPSNFMAWCIPSKTKMKHVLNLDFTHETDLQ